MVRTQASSGGWVMALLLCMAPLFLCCDSKKGGTAQRRSPAPRPTTGAMSREPPPRTVASRPRIRVTLVWHFHQPPYERRADGTLTQPWVRLHFGKDYRDMVDRAVKHGVPVVVNVTPSLWQQLQSYNRGTRDRFEELAEKNAKELTETERGFLRSKFFQLNHQHMLRPHAGFRALLVKKDQPALWTQQDYRDLQVWFHLAWLDPVWQAEPGMAALIRKGRGFSEADKRLVLARHRSVMREFTAAMGAYQRRGAVELTTSPYQHAILPLLVDTDVARQANPTLPLPRIPFRYPQDATLQIRKGVQLHRALFKRPPCGFWPSEGAVSDAVIRMLGAEGITWLATDEALLPKALHRHGPRVYRFCPTGSCGPKAPVVLFRSRHASDLLAQSHGRPPRAAARAVVRALLRLGDRQKSASPRGPVEPWVVLVMDGENPWEKYRNDGNDFLDAVYAALKAEPRIRMVLPCAELASGRDRLPILRHVQAGSWQSGSLDVWIGEPAENRAWELLAQARQLLDTASPSVSAKRRDQAMEALLKAEASDWFWYLGQDRGYQNDHDQKMDQAFRDYLKRAWRSLGRRPPDALDLALELPVGIGTAPPR